MGVELKLQALTGLRHPSFKEEGAGKRCSVCAVLGGGGLPAVALAMDVDGSGGSHWGSNSNSKHWFYDILPSFLQRGRCRKAVLGVWVELPATPSTGLRHPSFNHCCI